MAANRPKGTPRKKPASEVQKWERLRNHLVALSSAYNVEEHQGMSVPDFSSHEENEALIRQIQDGNESVQGRKFESIAGFEAHVKALMEKAAQKAIPQTENLALFRALSRLATNISIWKERRKISGEFQ